MKESPEKYLGPSVVAVEIITELGHSQHRTSKEYLRTGKKNYYPVGVALVTRFDVECVALVIPSNDVVKEKVTGLGSSLAVTNTTELDD